MFSIFFFFNDTATTEIYTLSLHDALPISPSVRNSVVTVAFEMVSVAVWIAWVFVVKVKPIVPETKLKRLMVATPDAWTSPHCVCGGVQVNAIDCDSAEMPSGFTLVTATPPAP